MLQRTNAEQTTPTYYEPERVAEAPEQHKLRVLIDEIATTRGLTIQMSLRLMMLVGCPDNDAQNGAMAEFCALAEQFQDNMTLIYGQEQVEGQPTDKVDWIRKIAAGFPDRRGKMLAVLDVVTGLLERIRAGDIPDYAEARKFHDINWPIVRDEMTKLIWDLWADLDTQKTEALAGAEKLRDTLTATLGDIKQISMTVRMVALNAGVLASRAGENSAGFSLIASEIKKLAEDIQTSASRADGVVIEMNTGHDT